MGFGRMREEVGGGVGGIVLFRWHWIPCLLLYMDSLGCIFIRALR
jgi:hypothetical protein